MCSDRFIRVLVFYYLNYYEFFFFLNVYFIFLRVLDLDVFENIIVKVLGENNFRYFIVMKFVIWKYFG